MISRWYGGRSFFCPKVKNRVNKVDINKNLTLQGATGYTGSNCETPPSATNLRRDVRMQSSSLQSVGGHQQSNQVNTQSWTTHLSVHNAFPVVNDNSVGCVVTRRRNSPLYLELVEKIKDQLASSESEESLKKIDKLYNRIINECEYSTEEIKELNYYRAKIAEHYFTHLEGQKDTLINNLHSCFNLRSSGGADVFFAQFINKVKELHSEFSPVMHEILYDIGLIILSSQFDHNRISQLIEQLFQSNNSGISLTELSQAESGELMECTHTAKQIVRRKGNHKPAVLENYLERLTTILSKGFELAESNRLLHIQALSFITSEITDKVAMNAGSDPEITWHRMFFEAVLDVRFPSDFMIFHQDIISKKPPQDWGLEELLGFITIIRSSGKHLGYCSAEFLTLLAKMDVHDFEQPISTPAADWDAPDDDGAVEHDEYFSPEVFTEEDLKRELGIFLQVVALEISGEFHHSKYDKHYQDWHVLVEVILGKRALDSPDARQVIKLLANLWQGGVKTSNLHFVDTTGNMTEAYRELDVAINKISEKKPDNITIRQNGHCTKASVYLWRNGQVIHSFEISAITTSGIPYESLALGIQLLAGQHSVRKLFSYQGSEPKFRYFHPLQLESKNKEQPPPSAAAGRD